MLKIQNESQFGGKSNISATSSRATGTVVKNRSCVGSHQLGQTGQAAAVDNSWWCTARQ